MQKKNSKLESFLYRTLPEDKYERIRGYESCIVVSEKENKSFKYVILGDEWIYLSENPPKTIQQAVALADVVSVELVNDYPEFLMGDDKKNCQHLAITYWTTEPVKRRSFRRKKSPRSSMTDLHGDRSNASTPLSMVSSQEVWSEDHGYSSLSSLQYSGNRPDSRGSINSARDVRKGSISKKKKKGGKTLHTIQSETEETILKSLKEEIEEDVLEDIENQSVIGDSYSKSLDLRNSQKPKSARSVKSAQSKKSVQSSRPLPVSPVPKNKAFETSVQDKSASSVIIHTEDLPKKNGLNGNVEHDEKEKTTCCFTFGSSKVSPFCGSDKVVPPSSDKNRLFSASQVSNKPMSEVHIEITSVNADGHFNDRPVKQRHNSINSSVTSIRGASRSGTPAQDDFERRSIASLASVSDFGGSMQRLSLLNADGFGEKRQAVLNLYLLSTVTPMLMLIRSAWSNFLLSSTLMMNPETIETPKGSILRSSHPQQREKIDLLFQQLKRDVFKAENDVEKLYEILTELRLGTEKNFSLKRLFWKNSDLFHFFVKKLQQYLPKSSVKVDKDTRSDEFEFSSLIIEVLCMMFHESEIIPERTQAMKAERGRSVVGLLMVLTCTPEVPDKIPAVEQEKMVTDFTKTSLGTVFELFLMAKQAIWGNSEGNFYNISWMVSVLEELKHTEVFISRIIQMMLSLISPSSLEKLSPEESVLLYQQSFILDTFYITEVFISRIIQMMLSLISPSSLEKLSPEESVLLYQQSFILDTFLQYSPRIKTFICAQYTEEFKYYVQPPVIMRRLPQAYPVYTILIALIEEVVKKVVPPAKPSKR